MLLIIFSSPGIKVCSFLCFAWCCYVLYYCMFFVLACIELRHLLSWNPTHMRILRLSICPGINTRLWSWPSFQICHRWNARLPPFHYLVEFFFPYMHCEFVLVSFGLPFFLCVTSIFGTNNMMLIYIWDWFMRNYSKYVHLHIISLV